MRAAAVVALACMACQPWYRDDLRRGRAARDHKRIEQLLVEARSLHAKGSAGEAAETVWEALQLDPFQPASTYLAYATYTTDAGKRERARDVIMWRMERDGAPELRAFVVRSFVEEERVADALDAAKVETLAAAAALPELAPMLGSLAEADAASTRDPASALAMYLAWLHGYGVPDHQLLEAARDRIVDSAAAMARWSAGCGTPMPPVIASLHGLATRGRGDARASYTLAFQLGALERMPPAINDASSAELPTDALAVRYAIAGDEAVRRGRVGAAVASYRKAVVEAPWWTTARDNLDALQAELGRDPIAYPSARGEAIPPVASPADAGSAAPPEAVRRSIDRAEACTTAAAHYDSRCRAGEPSACAVLAPLVAEGRGIARDEERACALGDGATCRAIGRRHQRPVTAIPANAAAAQRAHQRADDLARAQQKAGDRACRAGEREGCLRACRAGDVRTCDRACRAGDPRACVDAGKRQLASARDRAKGIATLGTACAAGEPDACRALAATVPAGAAPKPNAPEPVRKRCDAGELLACLDVAPEKARTGFLAVAAEHDRKRCDAGEGAACLEAAPDRARGAFQAACDRGQHDACAASTRWLLAEPGLDGARARDLLVRACDAGSRDGCSRLAALLASGAAESTAVKDANQKALDYYRRACDAKDAEGCALRDQPDLMPR